MSLPINLKYADAVNDKDNDIAGDQDNQLFVNSLDDAAAIIDGISDQVSDQVLYILNNELHGRLADILNIAEQWIKRDELFAAMNLSNHTKNRIKYLDPLLKIGWIGMEFPDKRTSPNQRYRITESGKKLLKLLKNRST